MKVKLLVTISIALSFVAFAAARAGDWRTYTPLPGDMSIEEPSADQELSPKIARLSGAWQGEWQSSGALGALDETTAGIRTTIVVEKISESAVVAIFSTGAYDTHSKGGWSRVLGRIERGDRVVFRLGGSQDRKLTLRLLKDNAAFGEYEFGGYSLRANLERKGQTEGKRSPAE